MKRMAIRLLTDGGVDFPAEWGGTDPIRTVPLYVTFDGKEFDHSLGLNVFYQEIKTHTNLPKTASPSPQDFIRAFEQYPDDDIILITISSNISSTYQHASMAKSILEESGGGAAKRKIAVLDSKTASMGTGLMLYRLILDVQAGRTFDEIVDRAQQRVPETKTFFYLDTLENVIKGGRLDRAKGAIASVLNIKLVMHASPEGTIEVTDKVRGRKNALNRLIEKFEDIGHGLEERVLGIAHSNCLEEAIALKDRILKRYPFRQAYVTEMGPVIGTYAGEGGLLVCYH